ncbi:hypothetical protein CRYUN_Cryun15aG0051000 [Craigia yunnanensis]
MGIWRFKDLDGTLVWTTNTRGKFVSGLNLTEEGNLVLYGRNSKIVWQSFDHPTDTLVPGQALVSGQKLTANVLSNSSKGLYSFALINDSLIAFLEADAQQVYFGPLKFIQLGSDGHLRAYQLRESKWEQVSDLLINYTGACGFPLVCGEYGVCSDGHYSCPKAEGDEAIVYFSQNFSVKLGEGGFGSVFYGSLPNSTKIAVKRLDGTDHVKKSFLAEVKTLGTAHHVNLVTLIGFCAEKSHRLLVYEYLQNGSLDRWIFSRNPVCTLSWKLRQKIIHDAAEGLAYLHNGCNQKILHLDIKPQNILLDENFNARLADFVLSKLIYRDQNQVLTTMRGTPGYMAPEWSSATITEKVDVYSFGIVVLEILCGRRNLDRSQREDAMHLLRLFTMEAEEGKLLELVCHQPYRRAATFLAIHHHHQSWPPTIYQFEPNFDKYVPCAHIVNKDMQSNGAEAVKMMRIASWCLQADYTRRPSMPTLLNVLKGYSNVEDNLSYDFLNLQAPRAIATPSNRVGTTTLALPSILSGPR